MNGRGLVVRHIRFVNVGVLQKNVNSFESPKEDDPGDLLTICRIWALPGLFDRRCVVLSTVLRRQLREQVRWPYIGVS